MTRRFIPFDPIWASPVPVPYAGLVLDRDRAWASGLFPLDIDGNVRFPGDAGRQANVLIDNARALFAAGEIDPALVSRAVLYLVPHDREIVTRLTERFAVAFGADTLIETVPVPGFQYPGALVQADLFCGPSEPVIEAPLPGGGSARVKREGGLFLMNLAAPVDTLGRAIGALLSKHALSPGQLLSGWGIAPEPTLSAVPGQIAPRLPGFFSGALMPSFAVRDQAHLYLTFGTGEVQLVESREGNVRLHMADAGDLAVLDGRFLGGAQVPLAVQTEAVMDGLGAALAAHGQSFANVVKSTSFIAEANTAEALHANMKIRKSYYPTPGPASTTVPIDRMADPGAKVRIEVVLVPQL